MNIQEEILRVMIEDEEESLMGANNVNFDAFSHASISQRENLDTIFTSENLEKLDELINAINNLIINDAIKELNTATTSDAQGNPMNDPDTVNHTSNGFFDQTLLSFWAIR